MSTDPLTRSVPAASPPRTATLTGTRVVVDALSARLGGGLSYLVPQLRALEAVAPHLDLEVIAAPVNADRLRASLRSRVTVVAGSTLRPLYEQTVLAAQGNRHEVLYCPGNFAPLAGSTRSIVLTLQNPNYFGSGRLAPHNRRIERRLRSQLSRWSARRADRVVVISQALLDEVRRDLPDVADRAVLIQSGAPSWPDESVAPPSLPVEIDDFVLSLANDAPHKHLDLTVDAWIDAFRHTSARNHDQVTPLVMAGTYFRPERMAAQRLRVPADLRSRFVQLGAITDRRHVRWLLEHARTMVSSATLEAHPLTPAEAGSLGCPLILSDIPAHREVAGDHATFVRAGSRRALTEALAATTSAPGVERRVWHWPVSWQDNARLLAAVLEEAGS
jgi:glycosyltransferase involved in cell wall biosynthesis